MPSWYADNVLYRQALEDVLTTREAAQVFFYSPRTIRRLAEEGVISARKTASGDWLVSKASLSQYVRARLDKTRPKRHF